MTTSSPGGESYGDFAARLSAFVDIAARMFDDTDLEWFEGVADRAVTELTIPPRPRGSADERRRLAQDYLRASALREFFDAVRGNHR